MNMETCKYYTPSIEEFHVGFEFETRQQEMQADECVYSNEWESTEHSTYHDNLHLQRNINSNYIRVKYLDREDIESFGFIHENSYIYKLGQYRLHFLENEKGNIIHLYDNVEDDDTIFLGIIKNKSELKVLLKQLMIL